MSDLDRNEISAYTEKFFKSLDFNSNDRSIIVILYTRMSMYVSDTEKGGWLYWQKMVVWTYLIIKRNLIRSQGGKSTKGMQSRTCRFGIQTRLLTGRTSKGQVAAWKCSNSSPWSSTVSNRSNYTISWGSITQATVIVWDQEKLCHWGVEDGCWCHTISTSHINTLIGRKAFRMYLSLLQLFRSRRLLWNLAIWPAFRIDVS